MLLRICRRRRRGRVVFFIFLLASSETSSSSFLLVFLFLFCRLRRGFILRHARVIDRRCISFVRSCDEKARACKDDTRIHARVRARVQVSKFCENSIQFNSIQFEKGRVALSDFFWCCTFFPLPLALDTFDFLLLCVHGWHGVSLSYYYFNCSSLLLFALSLQNTNNFLGVPVSWYIYIHICDTALRRHSSLALRFLRVLNTLKIQTTFRYRRRQSKKRNSRRLQSQCTGRFYARALGNGGSSCLQQVKPKQKKKKEKKKKKKKSQED